MKSSPRSRPRAEVEAEPSPADYRALAELRHQLRRFLSFSEGAARANGLKPQQHQLLLAIKGLPESARPTIKTLAERLCVKHHTIVALVDQVATRALVRRLPSPTDGREVLLALTSKGELILQKLSVQHREQLRGLIGRQLLVALAEILAPG